MTEREQPQGSTDPSLVTATSGLEARIATERAERERSRLDELEKAQQLLGTSQRDRERLKARNAANQVKWRDAAESERGKEIIELGVDFARRAQQARIKTTQIELIVGATQEQSRFRKKPITKPIRVNFPGWEAQPTLYEEGYTTGYETNARTWSREIIADRISVLTDGRIVHHAGPKQDPGVLFDPRIEFKEWYLNTDYFVGIFAKFLVDHGA